MFCSQNGNGNGNGADSSMTYDRKSANLTKGILTGYDHLARPCGKNTDDNDESENEFLNLGV